MNQQADQQQKDQLISSDSSKKYKYVENDPEYKGKNADENLRYGIIEDRHCTDMLFSLLFIGLWVGIVYVAQLSYKTGDPKRIGSPFDSSGNQCGIGAVQDFSFIYFPNPLSPRNSVCVKKCPLANTLNQTVECYANQQFASCLQSADPNAIFTNYESYPLVTLCVPASQLIYSQIGNYLDIPDMTKSLNDLKIGWAVILGSAFIALAISFLMLNLLKYCIKLIIWLQILLILVFLATTGTLSLLKYKQINKEQPNNEQKNYFLAASIIIYLFTFIYLICLCCFQKKIQLCIEILKQAANFINDVCSIVFVPFFIFSFSCLYMAFWITVTLYVYTDGTQQQRDGFPYGSMTWNTGVKRKLGFQIFSVIWNIEFIVAFSYFIISSSVAHWYFSDKNNLNADKPISKSVWKAFRYHFGTIAFGSLILTFIWILRVLIEIIHEQLKTSVHEEKSNALINFCCKCCQCCLDCFQRFIRFLNSTAYIMCSVTGKSFCDSAYDAFYTVIKNPIRFLALSWIGTIFKFIGQLLIILVTVLIAYLIYDQTDYYQKHLYSPIAPLVIIGVISYIISTIFMGIHSIAADTILYCFCLDEEIHSKSGQGPKYSPNNLHEFFQNNAM